MTQDELFDTLDGLFAYDNGCADAGIDVGLRIGHVKTELLRDRAKAELQTIIEDGRTTHQLVSKKFSEMIARYTHRYFLSEKAIAQGNGYEDLLAFLRWLHDKMDVPA